MTHDRGGESAGPRQPATMLVEYDSMEAQMLPCCLGLPAWLKVTHYLHANATLKILLKYGMTAFPGSYSVCDIIH